MYREETWCERNGVKHGTTKINQVCIELENIKKQVWDEKWEDGRHG
jgi:hypothetical protein